MANLIKCSDCGKKISINAQACPNCGAPAPTQISNSMDVKKDSTKWGYIFGVFFILMSTSAFATSFFAGVMILIGGVLALPVAQRALIVRNITSTRAPIIIASAVLVIIGTFITINKSQSDRKDFIKNNPEAYAAEQAEIAKRDAEKQAQNSTSSNTAQSGVSSTSEKMDFGTCVQKQNSVKNQIASSGNYNIIPIVQTSSLSVIRVCTNDGSVLLTCNAADGNMIATESTNRDGC